MENKNYYFWDIQAWKCEGALIGEGVVAIDAFIDRAFPYLVEVGDETVLTGCTVLAHDASIHRATGYSAVGVTRIGKRCFVGHGSIVLAGVTIGDDCIIGAGAVVSKDLPAGSVYVGSGEGRVVCSTAELFAKHSARIASGERPVFEKTTGLTSDEKARMRELVARAGGGYAR